MVLKPIDPVQKDGSSTSAQPLDTDVVAAVREANRQIIEACQNLGRGTRQAWLAIGTAVFMVLYGGDRARYESHAREKGVSLRDLAAGTDLGHSTLGNCVNYHLHQGDIPKAIRGLVSPAVELRYLQAAKISGARDRIDADITAGQKITVASINTRIKEALGQSVNPVAVYQERMDRAYALIEQAYASFPLAPSYAADRDRVLAEVKVSRDLGPDLQKAVIARDFFMTHADAKGLPVVQTAVWREINEQLVPQDVVREAEDEIAKIKDAAKKNGTKQTGIDKPRKVLSRVRRPVRAGLMLALEALKPPFPHACDATSMEKAKKTFKRLLGKDVSGLIDWNSADRYESKYPSPEGDDPYANPLDGFVIRKGASFNMASNPFHEVTRLACPCYDYDSPLTIWNKRGTKLEETLHFLWRLENDRVTANTYHSMFGLATYTAGQFRPDAAKAIYGLRPTEWAAGRFAGRVLDTSCGWGDRLAGFYATPTVMEYVGCDPNDENFEKYLKQCKFYEAALGCPKPTVERSTAGDDHAWFRVTGTKTVEIHLLPAEDFHPKGEFDMMFSSPPYFAVEEYGTGGKNLSKQSWKRYPTYDAWRDGFFFPMLTMSYHALKDDGFMVVNIIDPKVKGKRYFACDAMVAYLKGLGATFVGHAGMQIPERPRDSAKDHGLPLVEDLWIFAKHPMTLGPSPEASSVVGRGQNAESTVSPQVADTAHEAGVADAPANDSGVEGVIVKNTPVETYDLPFGQVLVKREDLACLPPGPPFSKVRGLYLLMRDLKAKGVNVVAYMDTSVSMAGWGVSYFAKQMGMKAIICYPAYKDGLVDNLAHHKTIWESYGAEVIPIQPNKLSMNFGRALRVMKAKYPEGGYEMIRQGFPTEHSVEQISLEVDNIPADVGTIVLSCGSGTTVSGVIRGLARRDMAPEVKAILADRKVCKAMEAKVLRRSGVSDDSGIASRLEVIDTDIGYREPVEGVPCPFPCNRFYDMKAWKWLVENYARLARPILFWNVGADGQPNLGG